MSFVEAAMERFPNHPVLTFFQNIFAIISVFSICFCLYSVACLYWLKPENMNIEFTQSAAIVLGVSFVIACPITVALTKKGRRLVAEEREQQKKNKGTEEGNLS